jgi:nucleotide-binding universal stress UspA family protein
MSDNPLLISDALFDFRQARRRAILHEIFNRFSGKEEKLLPYDEIRHLLKTQGSQVHGLKDIPLDAIVGSVNRYDDFTRSFLPRKTIDPQRWARIKVAANGMAGLPPIEVYQIGEVYFVIDGNHRVSVARATGASRIQAYVQEVPAHVQIKMDDSLEEVLLKAEFSNFMEETHLGTLRPGSDLRLTAPGQYQKLREQINHHQVQMGYAQPDSKGSVPNQEAVLDWYDRVFSPITQIIHEQGLQKDFPGRTEADLYLWIADHRAELEAHLHQPVETLTAATHLAEEQSQVARRKADRFTVRLKDTLVPATLEQGPPPGTWRKEKISLHQEDRLFKEILIPVDGTDSGWATLEQALVIAGKETSRLNGIYLIPSKGPIPPEIPQIQEKFKLLCDQAGIPGELVITEGPAIKAILERSRWNDLVVVNLNSPTFSKDAIKLDPGFRELVLRCPRPILVVHGQKRMKSVVQLSSPLLAYDGSPKAKEALYISTYLAEKWNLPLVILGVSEPGKEILPVLEAAGNYLRDRLGDQENAFKLVAREGLIANIILLTVEEENCDWIIMGGYSDASLASLLLENFLDKVLRSTRRPVLICR